MIALLATLLAQQPAVTGERSLVSKCDVSADPEYGYTREKPIKVGGTPMYGPARQRRFLQALAGPAGQPIAFKRRGSMAPNADNIILDLYEVTYPGLEKPIELYLDLYRWDPPKAPRGFLCATPIGLEPPPQVSSPPGNAPAGPVPGAPTPPVARPPGGFPRPPSWQEMIDFAIAAGKREELPPIPLDPYGSPRYGVAFDPFTRVARTSRASGGAVPEHMRVSRFGVETLVVAFPLECNGEIAKPVDIAMVANGRTMSRRVEVLKGAALREALPGYAAPADAIGVLIQASTLPAGELTITYDRAACTASPSVTLTVSRQNPAPERVEPVWPEGVPVPPEGSVRVTVHALIDHEGNATDVRVADGPEAFHAAAIDAMKRTRYGIPTINGVAVRSPRPVASTLVFRPSQNPIAPPPDPVETRRKVVDAALAWTGGDIPPIPLLPGSSARGMAFDPFRLIVLAARDAAARGRALTPQEAAAMEMPALLVVANPVECGGRLVAPEQVTLIGYVDSQERPALPVGALLKGDALQKLLPGVALTPGAAGAPFAPGWPTRGFVSIKYEGTACGDPVRLPITPGNPEKIFDVMPAWPPGMPVPPAGQTIEVRVRATIGVDGVPTDLQPLSPVSPFMVPAVEAVRQWRYRPMTINGEPHFVPITMNVVVTFSRK